MHVIGQLLTAAANQNEKNCVAPYSKHVKSGLPITDIFGKNNVDIL